MDVSDQASEGGDGVAIRVAIVDDDAMVRTLLSESLNGDGVDVVGAFASGEDAVASDADIDVWLVDLRLPGIQGVETTRRLLATNPDACVLVFSAFGDEQLVDALNAGASGFLRKDATPAQLRQAIRSVSKGFAVFSPSALEHAMRPLLGDATIAAACRDGVDSRIVELLGVGESYEQIAADVGMSVSGTKKRAARLMSALGVSTRGQLVARAFGLRD